jgi:haloacetate dehalogenase
MTKVGSKIVELTGATIRYNITGSGPPLLLLHGHPQTHRMWDRIVELLSPTFTLITADLRGYGGSSKPTGPADHSAYSKREMARDMIELMASLGYQKFAVAGHDRGGRVTHRLCLDFPEQITRAAVLDIAPTHHMYPATDQAFATGYWHWFFLIQPFPLPEQLIGADPESYWRLKCGRGASGMAPFEPAALADYLHWFAKPETIHAICEDYRASATIDLKHDQHDVDQNHRVRCPLLVLWGAKGKIGEWYQPLAVWRTYADQVSGEAIDAGHYLAEERPAEVADALARHFADTPNVSRAANQP